MFLGLLGGKRRVEADELAQMLWKSSCRDAQGLYDRIKSQLLQKGSPLSREEGSGLLRETVIASLWVVTRALPADENVLRYLHQVATSVHHDPQGNQDTRPVSFTWDELRERYDQYNGVRNEPAGGSQMLSAMMLRRMLPGRCAWLDPMLLFVVTSHIDNTASTVSQLRRNIKVI